MSDTNSWPMRSPAKPHAARQAPPKQTLRKSAKTSAQAPPITQVASRGLTGPKAYS